MDTIAATPGAPADHRVTYAQIGDGARMNLGARDFVHDDPNGLLMFRIGSGRVLRKAVVRLNVLDLYDVEIGRLDRRTLDWIVEASESDLYGDQLGEALIRMHAEVTR